MHLIQLYCFEKMLQQGYSLPHSLFSFWNMNLTWKLIHFWLHSKWSWLYIPVEAGILSQLSWMVSSWSTAAGWDSPLYSQLSWGKPGNKLSCSQRLHFWSAVFPLRAFKLERTLCFGLLRMTTLTTEKCSRMRCETMQWTSNLIIYGCILRCLIFF